jgi:hypothetical protein
MSNDPTKQMDSPMKLLADPPLEQWVPRKYNGADRHAWLDLINAHAAALGTGTLSIAQPLIATGHQSWLWHPGILAKDLAMSRAAMTLHAGMLHLAIDQDDAEALRLELPIQRGDRLHVETITLAPYERAVPVGCQPPVDSAAVVRTLEETRDRLNKELVADIQPLIDAFARSGSFPCHTLAQQITVALTRLRQPLIDPLPVLFVTDLPRLPTYQQLVDDLLKDARGCVEHYNRAAREFPEARVAPLRIEETAVELPLWKLGWNQPRRRVFAGLRGDRPVLLQEAPSKKESRDTLADADRAALVPRALLTTALVRSRACDLFIHGRGGAQYDPITEAWWRAWRGETLAPRATVSADLTMTFDAPVADRLTLERATWRANHLPHNLDRTLNLNDKASMRKRALIEHMHDDRDRSRRAEAFAEIHQINRGLADAHRMALEQAEQEVALVRAGVHNRSVAGKRDWCFALYDPSRITGL